MLVLFFFTSEMKCCTPRAASWIAAVMLQLSLYTTEMRLWVVPCFREERDEMGSRLYCFALDGMGWVFLPAVCNKGSSIAYITRQLGIWFYGPDMDFIPHTDLHRIANQWFCCDNTKVRNSVGAGRRMGQCRMKMPTRNLMTERDEAGRKPVHINKSLLLLAQSRKPR